MRSERDRATGQLDVPPQDVISRDILRKTYVTPIRLIQFLSLVAVFSVAFPYIRGAVPWLVAFLCMLGLNSLEVFCVGSLLSLARSSVPGLQGCGPLMWRKTASRGACEESLTRLGTDHLDLYS